jgi:hypothetical protein
MGNFIFSQSNKKYLNFSEFKSKKAVNDEWGRCGKK